MFYSGFQGEARPRGQVPAVGVNPSASRGEARLRGLEPQWQAVQWERIPWIVHRVLPDLI